MEAKRNKARYNDVFCLSCGTHFDINPGDDFCKRCKKINRIRGFESEYLQYFEESRQNLNY